MPEAPLEDVGSGLAPASDGWFVVNVRDTRWFTSDSRGSACPFQSPSSPFPQFGFNLRVLEPGQPNALYHSDSEQEAFLVVSGECRLVVEGEEQDLRPWDFFHCPAGTEHIFVGAGDGPCAIVMVGARTEKKRVHYPVSKLAARYGASVAEENLRSGAGVRGIGGTKAWATGVLGPAPLVMTVKLHSGPCRAATRR